MHPTSIPVCSPPATQTAASLPAPAAGHGVGSCRAWLAWDSDEHVPLPRWKRICGGRAQTLIGASLALLADPWGNVA
jgi:hypothetical protein